MLRQHQISLRHVGLRSSSKASTSHLPPNRRSGTVSFYRIFSYHYSHLCMLSARTNLIKSFMTNVQRRSPQSITVEKKSNNARFDLFKSWTFTDVNSSRNVRQLEPTFIPLDNRSRIGVPQTVGVIWSSSFCLNPARVRSDEVSTYSKGPWSYPLIIQDNWM